MACRHRPLCWLCGLLAAVCILCPAAAGAAPPAGTYSGVTSQGRSFSVTVNGSSQVTSYSISSTCGSSTISATCNIVADSFTCGSSPTCIPNGVPYVLLSGTFDPGYKFVYGSFSLAIQGPAVPIPPACCQLSAIRWMAAPAELLLEDGFEGNLSLAWSSFLSDEPFLDFSVFNSVWRATGGTDSLRLLFDDVELLRIPEGQLQFARGYRTVRVGLGSWAGGAHTVRFEATSYADGTRADFHLDDVVIDCPGGVANPVADPSFEAGTPNPSWSEESTNLTTPLCDPTSCSVSGARTGTWWVWFGGIDAQVENGAVTQPAVNVSSCP